jgi:hypothetical protein
MAAFLYLHCGTAERSCVKFAALDEDGVYVKEEDFFVVRRDLLLVLLTFSWSS